MAILLYLKLCSFLVNLKVWPQCSFTDGRDIAFKIFRLVIYMCVCVYLLREMIHDVTTVLSSDCIWLGYFRFWNSLYSIILIVFRYQQHSCPSLIPCFITWTIQCICLSIGLVYTFNTFLPLIETHFVC